jgi:hypothetical protein
MTARDLIRCPRRVVSTSPKRLVGLLCICVIFLLRGLLSPLPAHAYEQPLVGIEVLALPRGESALTVNGEGIPGRPGSYSISSLALRVPCAGRYRLRSESVVPQSEEAATSTAAIALSGFRSFPPGLACETPVPSEPGKVWAAFQGGPESAPFRLEVGRSGEGDFEGKLTIGPDLVCGQTYELIIDAWLRDWEYRLRYTAKVLATKTAAGEREVGSGCR